jgi:hypothetical protein
VCELDLLRVLPNGSDDAGARLIICGVPEGFAGKSPLVQTGFHETAAKVAAIEVIRALFEHNSLVDIDEIGCAVHKGGPVLLGVWVTDLFAVFTVAGLEARPTVHVHAVDVIALIKFGDDGRLLLGVMTADLRSKGDVRC